MVNFLKVTRNSFSAIFLVVLGAYLSLDPPPSLVKILLYLTAVVTCIIHVTLVFFVYKQNVDLNKENWINEKNDLINKIKDLNVKISDLESNNKGLKESLQGYKEENKQIEQKNSELQTNLYKVHQLNILLIGQSDEKTLKKAEVVQATLQHNKGEF